MDDEIFYEELTRINDLRLILTQMKRRKSDCTQVFKSFFDSVDVLSVYLMQCENNLHSARLLERVKPF